MICLRTSFTIITMINFSLIPVGVMYLSTYGYSIPVSLDNFGRISFRYDFVIDLIVWLLIAFSHQWSFMKKRDNLCALQDDFSHFSIESSKIQAVKIMRVISGVITLLVKLVLIFFGYWIPLHEVATSELKPVLALTNIFSIFFRIFISLSFAPGYILCSEMTRNLMKSTEEIFLDGIRTKVILKNTIRFIKRTKRTSKLLSPIYFHLSLCYFLPLTLRMYQLIDFGFSTSPHHMPVLFYIGIVNNIVLGLGGLWKINTQSEELKQHFKGPCLYQTISNLPVRFIGTFHG